MVWVALAVFTGLSGLCIAWPFLRKDTGDGQGSDKVISASEVTSLKIALQAVERDERLGLYSPTDAAQTKAGIAAEYSELSDASAGSSGRIDHDSKFSQYVALAAISVLSIASFGTYAASGSPDYMDQRLSWRLDNDQNVFLAHNVEKLEDYLSDNSQDAEAWAVIAPVYFEQENWRAAGAAYLNAVANGDFSEAQKSEFVSLAAQAAINRNMGALSPEAMALAKMAAELNPSNIRARYLDALATERAGNPEASARAWQAFVQDFNADTTGLRAEAQLRLAAMLQTSAEASGQSSEEDTEAPAASPPRGPTQEQVDAAASLSQSDRQAMIEGMVAGLALRLEDDPDNLSGWLRLVRSYAVLGRQEDAQAALDQAVGHFGNNAEALDELERTGETLGLETST